MLSLFCLKSAFGDVVDIYDDIVRHVLANVTVWCFISLCTGSEKRPKTAAFPVAMPL